MTEQVQEPTSDVDIDKVIARIQKMLSRTKTDRGTTEAEADTAMKMAQELMAKYNLDMAVVEAAAAKDHTSTKVERVKEEVKGRAMYMWQRELAKYVAEANFCFHLIRKESEWVEPQYELDTEFKGTEEAKGMKVKISRDERDALKTYAEKDMYHRVSDGRYKTINSHLFVGRKANVITAQLMYQYLTQTIEDLLPVTSNKERLSRSAMSWKEGCADRLCERLSARRADLIKKHDDQVKEDARAAREEFDRRRKEKEANTPKQLGADKNTEVKSAYDNLAAGAVDVSDNIPEADEPDRPEVDEGEQPWVPAGDDVPEVDPGSAMVLASVYDQSEKEANWEVAHGYEPGTLAKYRAERAARERQEAQAEAKQEVEQTDAPVKEETERQRKARERREAEEHAKNRRRWAREDAAAERKATAAWMKRDHKMYNAGSKKANDIGLDAQISAEGIKPKKLS